MCDELLASTASARSNYTSGKQIGDSAKLYSTVLPDPVKGESFHTVYDIVAIDATSEARADSQWTHRCPSSHFLCDTFISLRMNAPSAGTTSPRVGLNLIDRVIVRNGDTIQEFEYAPVMAYVLSKCDPNERQSILNAVGGNSSVAETIVIPLPLFWCTLGNGKPTRNNNAVPLFSLNAPLEIELTFNSDSALLASGGSFAGNAYDSVRMCHVLKKTHSSVYNSVRASGAWEMVAYDYQTATNRTVVPDASDVRTDLSQFDGSSVGLFINPVTTASLVANDQFVVTDGLSRVRTELNGAEFLRLQQNVDATTSERAMNWLSWKFGINTGADSSDPTFSHRNTFIPFAGSITSGDGDDGSDNQVHFSGYGNLRDFTKIDNIVRNDSGEEIQVAYMNIRFVKYCIDGGMLTRKK